MHIYETVNKSSPQSKSLKKKIKRRDRYRQYEIPQKHKSKKEKKKLWSDQTNMKKITNDATMGVWRKTKLHSRHAWKITVTISLI